MSLEEKFTSITKYYEDGSSGVTGICPPEKDFSIGYVDISFSDFKRVVSDCCLDKQRVKEAIKHLATTTVECETGCFDDTKEEIIVVKELLKELGLEDE